MSRGIGSALFTKAQQKVLALLFGQPEKSFYLNEVIRLADMGKGVINRELTKLVAAGLLVVTKQGNQNHYQANKAAPIFNELVAIVQKTLGARSVLQQALSPILPRLEQAFIYGSVAKGEDHAGSDIDVMLVGEDLSYSDIMALLDPAESQLQRTVNPTIYSPQEFEQRLQEGQNFLTKVTAQTTINLLDE
ncbi:nucleotidyltransferase domain-containing protein [Simiduia curdlanivorans]|uniref:Nucleotidyltransferase domain-containing protein n=1 Tax=Simiduia curdlanivorans TaxID=1492769 RepID=A0ABV8V6C6_9GAMM|nr:nucleotidyltransferase domain-containing protein [Simiduia curdlanivorans]MDN3638786.1 nucleotidyltransferase domain-containing protein [Simiduia curdlanivorans]